MKPFWRGMVRGLLYGTTLGLLSFLLVILGIELARVLGYLH